MAWHGMAWHGMAYAGHNDPLELGLLRSSSYMYQVPRYLSRYLLARVLPRYVSYLHVGTYM